MNTIAAVLWECAWADISVGYDQRNKTEEVLVTYNIPGGSYC